MSTPPEPAEVEIRRAREHSNRSIVRRNLLGVGDSLAEDYVGVIGDGTFVPSRTEYLRLFKMGFDAPKSSLSYERLAERIDVAADGRLAAEHGQWIARDFNGNEVYTGSYAAMWRRGASGWKIRSEIFVTLTETLS